MTRPDLRPYQNDAARFLNSVTRGLVHAPAGSGKTVIGAAALDIFFQVPGLGTALWVCNTIEQKAQAEKALEALLLHNVVRVECVAARPQIIPTDSVLVVDEAHHAPALTWIDLIESACKNHTRIWGLTATPWHYKDQARNDLILKTFVEIFEVDREALEADGHLVKAEVTFHDPAKGLQDTIEDLARADQEKLLRQPWWSDEARARRTREILWQWTQFALVHNEERNFCIRELMRDSRQSTLVIVGTVAQAIDFCVGGSAVAVYSKLPKAARRERIAAFRSGYLKTLVATNLADEGLDVPVASRLILAIGGRSPQKLDQRIGRVLRPSPGKAFGEVHDFLDSSSLMAYAQAQARNKVYLSHGFSVINGPAPVKKAPKFNHEAFANALRSKKNG